MDTILEQLEAELTYCIGHVDCDGHFDSDPDGPCVCCATKDYEL